jgi:hypothetical protein
MKTFKSFKFFKFDTNVLIKRLIIFENNKIHYFNSVKYISYVLNNMKIKVFFLKFYCE